MRAQSQTKFSGEWGGQMKFEQVGFTYQKGTPFAREGLRDITWAVKEPNMLAVVGETGSGKSTLMQHLNGLLKPTQGVYSHGNVRLAAPYKKGQLGNLRQEIGMVFQFPEKQLFHESVQEDLVYGPMNFGCTAVESLDFAKEALAQVQLDEGFLERKIDTLSGGEKRRVAIASVLSMRPQVLVLDEPTAGLDPKHKTQMMQLLRSLYTEQKMTVIWVTHDMEDVLTYAEEMAIMSKGRIMHTGKPVDIFHTVDIEPYGLLKPRVISLKEAFKQKFDFQLAPSITDLEKVLRVFIESYQAGECK